MLGAFLASMAVQPALLGFRGLGIRVQKFRGLGFRGGGLGFCSSKKALSEIAVGHVPRSAHERENDNQSATGSTPGNPKQPPLLPPLLLLRLLLNLLNLSCMIPELASFLNPKPYPKTQNPKPLNSLTPKTLNPKL